MRKESYKILTLTASIIIMIFAISAGIYSIYNLVVIPRPEGQVLTQEFITAYIGRKACKTLAVASFASLMFGIFGVAMYLSNGTVISKGAGLTATLIWVIVAIGTVFLLSYRSIPLIIGKPHAETVQVVNRHRICGRYNDAYLFNFSNGSMGNVSKTEYLTVPDGTTYYVIMCGNTCAEAFNAEDYLLPASR